MGIVTRISASGLPASATPSSGPPWKAIARASFEGPASEATGSS